MGNISWVLEVVLVGLLGFTLVHAVRLERALHALRQDRAALGDAITGFDSSARQAEAGFGRLQSATLESAHLLGQRLEQGASLNSDLQFLINRGEAIADRLDELVRISRPMTINQPPMTFPPPVAEHPPIALVEAPKVRSQAERDLLVALRGA